MERGAEVMSVDESWHEPSRLQGLISNFPAGNLPGCRLPFPTSSPPSLHLEAGCCGCLTGCLQAWAVIALCCEETCAPESCASHARQSPCCPQEEQGPEEQLCPHLWGSPQLLTSLCTPDLFLWEAKWSREFPPPALTETTNISLCRWRAARDSQTCCGLEDAQESISSR